MPRPSRLLVDDGCYHILTRGNNRAAVFHADADRQRYGQLLLRLSREHGVAIYHYCLMTNHVHLIVRASVGTALRQALQRLNLTYAHYLHRTYGHVGHVWQDRFKSLLLGDDAYLLQCGAYVELNPVRAKMVATPAAYPWSSYRMCAQGRMDPLVTLSPTYLALGPTPSTRQQRYQHFVESQAIALPPNWLSQPALGSPESFAALRARGSSVIFSRPRGRPRKTPLLTVQP